MKYVLIAALAALAAVLCSQAPRVKRLDSSRMAVFVKQWLARAAGRETDSRGNVPMSAALAPGASRLLVLNGGYMPPSISVLDTAGGRELSRVPLADGWLGLTFAPDGKHVYVGGGSRASVFEFAWKTGR
jgi:DNA-binding beta-propeller fold protein YncE